MYPSPPPSSSSRSPSSSPCLCQYEYVLNFKYKQIHPLKCRTVRPQTAVGCQPNWHYKNCVVIRNHIICRMYDCCSDGQAKKTQRREELRRTCLSIKSIYDELFLFGRPQNRRRMHAVPCLLAQNKNKIVRAVPWSLSLASLLHIITILCMVIRFVALCVLGAHSASIKPHHAAVPVYTKYGEPSIRSQRQIRTKQNKKSILNMGRYGRMVVPQVRAGYMCVHECALSYICRCCLQSSLFINSYTYPAHNLNCPKLNFPLHSLTNAQWPRCSSLSCKWKA